MNPKILTLRLKRKWFEAIQNGSKELEYRLATPYWTKRLKGRKYHFIVLTLGYPKRGDTERTIVRAWNGCEVQTVRSEEWGNRPRRVYVIDLTIPWKIGVLLHRLEELAEVHPWARQIFFGKDEE